MGWLVQCRESHLTDFREALLIREVRWRENLFGGFATLNQPPRPRPLRRLRDIFLMGAATPPWPRRGILSAPVSPCVPSSAWPRRGVLLLLIPLQRALPSFLFDTLQTLRAGWQELCAVRADEPSKEDSWGTGM